MIHDQPSNVFFGGAFNVDGQGAMLISKTQLTEKKKSWVYLAYWRWEEIRSSSCNKAMKIMKRIWICANQQHHLINQLLSLLPFKKKSFHLPTIMFQELYVNMLVFRAFNGNVLDNIPALPTFQTNTPPKKEMRPRSGGSAAVVERWGHKASSFNPTHWGMSPVLLGSMASYFTYF